MSTEENKTDAYKQLGVKLKAQGSQAKGDCPMCGKEGHFFVSIKTGQFDCKVCGEKGNIFTFAEWYYKDKLLETTGEDYERLSGLRDGLPPAALKAAKLAYDADRGRWLIPLANPEGKFAGVRLWSESDKTMMYVKGFSAHLYRGETIKKSGPIWVCEGEWDAIALVWLMEKNKIDLDTNSVVAVPGANIFKDDWVKLFSKREVYLIYDNDSAGEKGKATAEQKLDKKTLATHVLHWPSDISLFPEKYDLRDFVCQRIKHPKKAWPDLLKLFEAQKKLEQRKLPKRDTFASVVKDFKSVIHMNKNQEDALAVVIAVTQSVKIKSDCPLWVFLVGPPGCGKTQMLLSFMGMPERCEFISKMTSQALVSGYKGGEDPSLLPKLSGRTLMVKDYTAIKSLPQSTQEELYGILRDAYDGSVKVPFGNQEPRVYDDCWFSLIAGVTHVIHGDNRASLGERFLKFELLGDDHSVEDHIRAALSNANDIEGAIESDNKCRDSITAFMSRPFDPEKLPNIPEWFIDRIVAISQIASILRASVDRKGDELNYRPQPEIGTRIGKQLMKLAQCLCWVYGKTKIDEDIYKIVSKTAMDTIVGWNLEIIQELVNHPKGASVYHLSAEIHVSSTTVYNKLRDLYEIFMDIQRSQPVLQKMVVPIDEEGDSERTHTVWFLDARFIELWKQAKLPFNERATPTRKRPTRGPKQGAKYKKKKPQRRFVRS